ncbi:hypothetical protein DOM22_06095 [Bdellovibrio sp. ZAP7]|uniref:hypothetical protein n=1 Tax=Bdellovibrio sp. ZAP7 TaxID=2231053 RepID=UPI001156ED6E|nr:hypothetical protein [Bdellovibrio sp. ZAP7]QDK44765.1 hypothetical protein DOM22_06095 [Bdellovibrio sp. ZAP7]
MKWFLLSLILISSPSAFADQLVGEIKIQTAQVLNETQEQTSCRLYRKRIDTFLQRSNEAAVAAAMNKGNLTQEHINRVLDIIQRGDVPAEVQNENILWTLDFDVSKAIGFLSQPLHVEIDSTYLQFETNQNYFPNHFNVAISEDKMNARITYRMTYAEACLAPVKVRIKLSADAENSLELSALLNRNLI